MSKNFFNSWKFVSKFGTVSRYYKKNQFQKKKVGGHDDQYIVNTGNQYSFIDSH